jgi:pimeloyl-ACP methyl ester carboxylesterase
VLSKAAHLSSRSIRYLNAGGGGQTMVLLHAFPLSADQWLPDLHRVPSGWRFIAPDLRGFRGAGRAFEPTGLEGLTMDDYAADVLELMDHLELQQAGIAGLSMGGYVALALVRRAMARVERLVLVNTRASADSAEGRAGRDRMIDVARRDGAAGIAREMTPKLLGETTRRERPDLADAVAHMIERNPPEALIAALEAMKARPDSTPLLASIRCPTTVVWSEEDTVIPRADAEAMHAAIAGSRMVVLPRAGHLSNLETSLTPELVAS